MGTLSREVVLFGVFFLTSWALKLNQRFFARAALDATIAISERWVREVAILMRWVCVPFILEPNPGARSRDSYALGAIRAIIPRARNSKGWVGFWYRSNVDTLNNHLQESSRYTMSRFSQ